MGVTEDEMVGWHLQLKGHEFGQTPGDSEGQGSLAFMGLQRVGHHLTTEQHNSQKKKNSYKMTHLFGTIMS